MKYFTELKKSFNSIKDAIPKSESSGTQRVYGWVAAFLAGILLYFALRGIDWNESLQTIKGGKYWLAPGLLLWASGTDMIRAVRWRLLLQTDKKMGLLPIFWANMIGYFGNLTLPARAGEALRAISLGRNQRLSATFVFATCLVERVMDAIVLVLIGSGAMLAQKNISPLLVNAIKIMAGLGLLALVLMVLLPYVKGRILNFIDRVPLSQRNRDVLVSFVENFSQGFWSLRKGKRMLSFFGLTGIIWLSDTMWYILGGYIFNLNIPWMIAIILIASLGLSSAIPSTPGYIGIYQFVAVLVLTPFGINKGDAIAYITAMQFFSILQVTFWATFGIFNMRNHQSEIRPV